jgi:hypothetical protein
LPVRFECVASDTTTGQVGVVDVGVNSAGTYDLNCLTGGSVTSTSNQLAGVTTLAGSSQPGTDLGVAIPGMAYKIFFIGEEGRLFWQPGSSITSTIASVGGSVRASIQDPADGVISVVPNFDANVLSGQCTTRLTVTGVITGSFSGL